MSYQEKNTAKPRSPLKAAPLRYAGQSLDEEIRRVMVDDVFVYLMAAGYIFVLALHEWWRWYSKSPPQPVIFTALAFMVLAYSTRKLVLAIRKLKTLRMARDGTNIQGQTTVYFELAGSAHFGSDDIYVYSGDRPRFISS